MICYFFIDSAELFEVFNRTLSFSLPTQNTYELMNRNYFFLSISLYFIVISNVSGQTQNQEAYKWLDNITGIENTILFNGIEFIDEERTVNEKNKFLYSSQEFKPGSVTYDGQFFPDIRLKYNVYDDVVLVKLSFKDKISIFQLITSKIDQFSIRENRFINLSNQRNLHGIKGFYQLLGRYPEFSIYKKYRKRPDKKLDRDFLYYEFKDLDPEYYLEYQNEFLSVNSRGELYSIFPEYKQEIKSLYKQKDNMRKSNPDAFMVLLFQNLSNLIKRNQ